MNHLGVPGSARVSRMDPTAAQESPPLPGSPAELSVLPPLADVVSREIRRMGRAWKIEGVKALLQVVLTMLVMTVLGAGWLIFFAVFTALGWYLWSTFSVKASITPYRLRARRSQGRNESDTPRGAGEEYAEWLLGSENSTE